MRATAPPVNSIGLTLTDTLDELISENRIDPQLAIKIIQTYDRAITEVLQEKVKARLQFKVRSVVDFGSRPARKKGRRLTSGSWLLAGLPRYLSILRRCLDLSDQKCPIQDG